MKGVQRTLQKVQKDGSDLYLALLMLRSTPVDFKLSFLAELLQGQSFQSTLPKLSLGEDVLQRLVGKQTQQKRYYDEHT